MSENRSCPCNYLDEPCHPMCTCKNGASSLGCLFCCTYGSEEQRKERAKQIAKKLRPIGMRTFIFRKGEETEAVKAEDIQGAWDALEAKLGNITGWELQASQG